MSGLQLLTDSDLLEHARFVVNRSHSVDYMLKVASECKRRHFTATEDAILRAAADHCPEIREENWRPE